MKNATARRDSETLLDAGRNRAPCFVNSPNTLFLLTLSLAFIATTTGCTQPVDPMEVLIPADPEKWEKELFPHIERINNVDDKYCVLEYLRRLEKGKKLATGLKVGHLSQVGCAILEMESKISVTLVEQRDVREKDRFGGTLSVPIDFIVDIENTSGTDILGLRASLQFYNVFGRYVGSVDIYLEERFPARSHKNLGSVRKDMVSPFVKLITEPNNEALGRLARGEYKYKLIVSAMVLSDGTKYEIPGILLP